MSSTLIADKLLNNYIESAKEIVLNGSVRFDHSKSNCTSFYTSTNEFLSYLKQSVKCKDADVLCPTGSGDHMLNALYLGAKSVETFDINALAFFNQNLKICAVKYLDYDEFLDFYSTKLLDIHTYFYKLREHLNYDVRKFFDEIYALIFKYEKADINNLVLEQIMVNKDRIKKLNPYLESEASFKKLKSILLDYDKPIINRLIDANRIGNVFKNKDIVMLSNIPSYMLKNVLSVKDKPSTTAYNETKSSLNSLLSSALKCTKKDGTIIAEYLFNRFKDVSNSNYNRQNKNNDREKLLFKQTGLNPEVHKINGTEDEIILIKKRNNSSKELKNHKDNDYQF